MVIKERHGGVKMLETDITVLKICVWSCSLRDAGTGIRFARGGGGWMEKGGGGGGAAGKMDFYFQILECSGNQGG